MNCLRKTLTTLRDIDDWSDAGAGFPLQYSPCTIPHGCIATVSAKNEVPQPGAWMETFGNVIFWMIKIFLLLIGFALILGGGFCVVMPLFERSGGYGIIFVGVGLAALLIGCITFWAALRIIRKSSAAQAQAAEEEQRVGRAGAGEGE